MKKIQIFFILLLFILVAGISTVSAEPLQLDSNGTVNGGVVIDAVQPTPWKEMVQDKDNGPFNRTFNHTFNIAPNADVQWAHLYVFMYSGSASNSKYRLYMNTSYLNGSNYSLIKNHTLDMNADTSSRVYPTGWNVATDTVIKNGGDYLVSYDVKNITNGKTSINFKVDTAKMGINDTYYFDGRLKAIVLAYTYNLTNSDKTYKYWINIGQDFIKGRANSTPPTGTNLTSEVKYDLTGSEILVGSNSTLYALGLGSYDAIYKWNASGNLTDISLNNHPQGNYSFFEFNIWNDTNSNISKLVNYSGLNFLKFFINYNGTYQYTPSFKLGLSALVVDVAISLRNNKDLINYGVKCKECIINKNIQLNYKLSKNIFTINKIKYLKLNSYPKFNIPIKNLYFAMLFKGLLKNYKFSSEALTNINKR